MQWMKTEQDRGARLLGASGFLKLSGTSNFHSRKEVIARKYCIPQIEKIAEAIAAIRFDQSLAKSMSGADLANPHRMTVPAYSADDDE